MNYYLKDVAEASFSQLCHLERMLHFIKLMICICIF